MLNENWNKIRNNEPRTFREVGMILEDVRQDVEDLKLELRGQIGEIKANQKRVINWLSGLVSSLVVGGILGYLFQK